MCYSPSKWNDDCTTSVFLIDHQIYCCRIYINFQFSSKIFGITVLLREVVFLHDTHDEYTINFQNRPMMSENMVEHMKAIEMEYFDFFPKIIGQNLVWSFFVNEELWKNVFDNT